MKTRTIYVCLVLLHSRQQSVIETLTGALNLFRVFFFLPPPPSLFGRQTNCTRCTTALNTIFIFHSLDSYALVFNASSNLSTPICSSYDEFSRRRNRVRFDPIPYPSRAHAYLRGQHTKTRVFIMPVKEKQYRNDDCCFIVLRRP